jgi:hypothetical protein
MDKIIINSDNSIKPIDTVQSRMLKEVVVFHTNRLWRVKGISQKI